MCLTENPTFDTEFSYKSGYFLKANTLTALSANFLGNCQRKLNGPQFANAWSRQMNWKTSMCFFIV